MKESLEKIIESSNFLLQFQKEALLLKFEENEVANKIIDRRVAYLTFLDEVLRKLLNKGIDELLSTRERRDVDYVLDDMVGEIDD